ncbi:hypothetical protein FXN63_15955 [Pigmentiphaga aceris]|uniref:SMP-30/Gluconolactonase/LRE-like region domain-containing protein n=1 Tax=Pigmentiphaga aceris TaxID=1940612 RepID=A0A5C0B3L3_9BURK|nr:hypothetical protein [Pigmentiphaga aceris]QEI07167.1 hypothetical protein FXN63_15955 [Pigmentiphaga aceris]
MIHIALAAGVVSITSAAVTGVEARADTVPASLALSAQKPVRIHENLASPVGMAYDAQGNLYVANWSAGTVLRFTSTGQQSVFADGFSSPVGLALAPDGSLTVATWGANAAFSIRLK